MSSDLLVYHLYATGARVYAIWGGNFVRAREGLSRVPTSFGGAVGVRTVGSRRDWDIYGTLVQVDLN